MTSFRGVLPNITHNATDMRWVTYLRQFIRGVDQEVNFVSKPVHDLFPGFPVLIFAVLGLDAMVGIKVPTPVGRRVLVGVLRQGRKRFPLDGESLSKMGQSGP